MPSFASYEEILGIEKSLDFRRRITSTIFSVISHTAFIVAISFASWLAREKIIKAAQEPRQVELVEIARIAPPPGRGQLPALPVHAPSVAPEGNAPIEREGQKIGSGNVQIAQQPKPRAPEISLDKSTAQAVPSAAEKPPAPAIDTSVIAPPPAEPPQQTNPSKTPSAEDLKKALDSTFKPEILSQNPNAPARANGDKDISIGIEGLNLGIYRERLEYRIKRNWFPPTYTNLLNRRASITVYFDLYRDGHLKVTGHTTTGNGIMDRAAINAINSTNPYDPLPPSITLEKIPLYAVFNY